LFKLIYTNSANQSIELYEAPYRLINVEGLGGTEVDVQTQKSPYQDGSTYVDSVLENKSIEIQIKITGNDESDLTINRRKISSIFSPNLGMGVLRFINDEGEKEIDVVVEAVPFFPDGSTNRQRTFQKALIHLQAPDPYWRDPLEVSRTLVAFAGTFSFPLRFPLRFGTRGDSEVLTNTGDVTTPVKINIQGPVEVPQVINETTGQYIRANVNLFGGDILHIDTSKNHKRVEIYRGNSVINAFGHLDRMSDLWSLSPGDNVIKYSANRGRRDGAVAIAWHNRYLGV
jgi:phage-related protein